jgi:hypothetical protein
MESAVWEIRRLLQAKRCMKNIAYDQQIKTQKGLKEQKTKKKPLRITKFTHQLKNRMFLV